MATAWSVVHPSEVQTPAPVALSTRVAYCVADEVCVRTDSRCSCFHVRRFAEALALGQKIVQLFWEASTLSAPSEARSSLSALYRESGRPRRRSSK